jgi:hypothetical protein
VDGGPGSADAAATNLSNREASSNDPAILRGAVQKGPFVLGSTVTLSAIDATGAPTGQTFSTQTLTSLGDFEVFVDYRGPVNIEGEGFYYNEITGKLSTAPITLRSLYDIEQSGTQGVHVNLITHLAHDRALKLLSAGAADGGSAGGSMASAEVQAEAELVAALGIGGSGFVLESAAASLDELGDDTDANAYLFAVSAIALQAAMEQVPDGGSFDATLQELLNTIASDLADDGQISGGIIGRLRTAEQHLDIDLTTRLFEARLRAIGSIASVAKLDRVVDSDGDGYPNSFDSCAMVSNPDQSVPSGVLCNAIAVDTPVPSYVGTTPLAVADFTQIGHPGVLLFGDAVILGDGSGRFVTTVLVTPPQGKAPEAVLDIDQDGKLDRAYLTDYVAGDGTNHFGTPIPYDTSGLFPPPGLLYRLIAFGDVNGDGLLDVVRLGLAWPYEWVVVSYAVSKGVFGPPYFLNLGLHPYMKYASDLNVVDLNDDGILDLVVAGAVDGPDLHGTFVWTMLGYGPGNFRQAREVRLGYQLSSPAHKIAIGDFDGDHLPDLADVGTEGYLSVRFGDALGALVESTSVSFKSPGHGPAVVAGDFTGDGIADVVAMEGDATDPDLAHLAFVGMQGRLPRPPTSLLKSRPLLDYRLVVGDINGDGTSDIVLGGLDATQTRVLRTILMNPH